MPRAKVTLGMQQATIGPTESYVTPDGTLDTLQGIISDMINLRQDLLYENVNITGARVALVNPRRRSVFYPPGTHAPFAAAPPLIVPSQGELPVNINQGRHGDQARACLQIRLRFSGDRTVLRYFSLIPDRVTSAEPSPPIFSGPTAAWKTAFDTFCNFLISGAWAVRARDLPPGSDPQNPVALTAIKSWVRSSGAPMNVGLVVDALPAPGIAQGAFVQVSNVRRRGTDRLSYNGRYFVEEVNTTQLPGKIVFYLRGTEAIDPDSIKLPGTVYPIRYAFFAIQKIEPVRVGVHKRGKPLGSPVGRRVKRPSLGV